MTLNSSFQIPLLSTLLRKISLLHAFCNQPPSPIKQLHFSITPILTPPKTDHMLPEIACILFNIPRVTLIHFFLNCQKIAFIIPFLKIVAWRNHNRSTFVFKKSSSLHFSLSLLLSSTYSFSTSIAHTFFLIFCRAQTHIRMLGITLLNVCHLVCPMYND